ncbi:MAG: two-component system sensor histidine kinase RppB, partial [Prochloraceae cyanobacterium]
ARCFQVPEKYPDATAIIGAHKYYIRLLDISQNLVAVVGREPKDLQITKKEEQWQTLTDAQGDRYLQFSFLLHTQEYQKWGYLQLIRHLEDFEDYAANLQWMLVMGLPAVLVILMIISWWLAGQAIQPIYNSYKLLQQFTADAAHELRTPLAAIRATVESTLMMPTLNQLEARETLQKINRQNLRLSKLVADLLILCRLERQLKISSQPEIKCEPVSLYNLVKNITEDFAALALASQIELTSQILGSEPLSVNGNYEQLYRLVSNLVINALQYTIAGGKVTLIITRRGDWTRLHVKDTGIGISAVEQTKIFDRFYRANKARSRQTGGSGLGLSIAKAIVQAHQGKLQVQSKLGKGTTFTISLPATDCGTACAK